MFYNNSFFDGGDSSANAGDEGAIAPTLAAYRPGDGLAAAHSVSSYTRGINGLIIDVAGNHGPLSVSDFTFRSGNNNAPQSWAAAPLPTSILVRAGEGVGGSDRVHLVWNDGAIVNTWLEVIVAGNDTVGGFNTNTGLAASDVFFWGSKVADSGTSPGASTFQTTSTDAAQVFAAIGAGKPITDLRDYNRDGQVTSTDAASVFASIGNITRLNIGAGGPFAPEAAPARATSGDGDHVDTRSAVAAALAIRSDDILPEQTVQGSPAAVVSTETTSGSPPSARQALDAAYELSCFDLDIDSSAEAPLSDELLEALLAASLTN